MRSNAKQKIEPFQLGTCTVPNGKRGPWTIDSFSVSKDQAFMFNMSHVRTPTQWIEPGRYRRLSHRTRGVVMSNTPMEVNTNREAYVCATGRVIVNGLGMGMLLEALLSKPDVSYVRVIEIDPDVIGLVGHHFASDRRVEIVQADALTYRPAKGETFDYAWHDIWDDICQDNLKQMATLGRRYNRYVATKQGFWSRGIIRADIRSCR